MLVQLLHLIPERFLIFCQYAQEWMFEVWVKLRKQNVALMVLVLKLKEGQYAVVLAVHQALQVGSAVQCQERNETNNHWNENKDWHSREFLSSSFSYSHQSPLEEFSVNHLLLKFQF